MAEQTERSYWLDLFTWDTWRMFLASDRTVSGFRRVRRGYVQRMRVGDYLLCYLTGVSRFVGILEVTSLHYSDETVVWSNEMFPERVRVRPLVILTSETGVPAQELLRSFSWYSLLKKPNDWGVYFQGSPRKLSAADGELAAAAILKAEADPVVRPVDKVKLNRRARGGVKQPQLRSEEPPDEPIKGEAEPTDVPGEAGPPQKPQVSPEDAVHVLDEGLATGKEVREHTEAEGLLLTIGSLLGLQLWVDRSDRNEVYNGFRLGDIPSVLDDLPNLGFPPEMVKRIERIDVLWFDDGTVVAAFEVEATTAVYSGLLRLADLVALAPNSEIPLFIVAPSGRRTKVQEEVGRPTFAKALKRPLGTRCRFITFEELRDKYAVATELGEALRPGAFLKAMSEPLDERS